MNRKPSTLERFPRNLLVLLVAFFAIGLANLASADNCQNWEDENSGNLSYSGHDHYEPSFWGDGCDPEDYEECIDCTLLVDGGMNLPDDQWDWVHCGQNFEGTVGECALYENYGQLPSPPGPRNPDGGY